MIVLSHPSGRVVTVHDERYVSAYLGGGYTRVSAPGATAAPKPAVATKPAVAPKPVSTRQALLAEKKRLEREIDRSRAAANVAVLGRDLDANERAIVAATPGCTELAFAEQKAQLQGAGR